MSCFVRAVCADHGSRLRLTAARLTAARSDTKITKITKITSVGMKAKKTNRELCGAGAWAVATTGHRLTATRSGTKITKITKITTVCMKPKKTKRELGDLCDLCAGACAVGVGLGPYGTRAHGCTLRHKDHKDH
jgi:hypothetical protein